MIDQLATATATADPLISGNWIIAAIGALASAAALVMGKMQGRKEAETKRTVKVEDQPLKVTADMPEPFATLRALESLKSDVHGRLKKIEVALNEERGIARTANSNIHQRIDKLTENTAELNGQIDQVDKNVRLILERLLS
jgi:hypothetical protein